MKPMLTVNGVQHKDEVPFNTYKHTGILFQQRVQQEKYNKSEKRCSGRNDRTFRQNKKYMYFSHKLVAKLNVIFR